MVTYIIHSSTPYLLFSTWSTVSRMNLDGSGYTVLVDSASNVGTHAVDYHLRYTLHFMFPFPLHERYATSFRLNLFFWGHYRDGTVNQANLDGSNPTIIASNISTPSEYHTVR